MTDEMNHWELAACAAVDPAVRKIQKRAGLSKITTKIAQG